jgi:hypothetical protein
MTHSFILYGLICCNSIYYEYIFYHKNRYLFLGFLLYLMDKLPAYQNLI